MATKMNLTKLNTSCLLKKQKKYLKMKMQFYLITLTILMRRIDF